MSKNRRSNLDMMKQLPESRSQEIKQKYIRLRPSRNVIYDMVPSLDELISAIEKEERTELVKRIKQGDDTVVGELTKLTEREREVVKMYFGLGTEKRSAQEIGDRFGITPTRVYQIKDKALRRLTCSSYIEPLHKILKPMR